MRKIFLFLIIYMTIASAQKIIYNQKIELKTGEFIYQVNGSKIKNQFIMLWACKEENNYIKGQIFNENLETVNNEFVIDSVGALMNPSVSSIGNGNMIICWERHYPEYSGWFEIRDMDGNVIKNKTKFIEKYNRHLEPIPYQISNGNAIIVWKEPCDYSSNYKYQVVDSTGNFVSTTTQINDSTEWVNETPQILDSNDGYLTAFWLSNWGDIYIRNIDYNGQILEDKVLVHSFDEASSNSIILEKMKNGNYILLYLNSDYTYDWISYKIFDKNFNIIINESKLTELSKNYPKIDDIQCIPNGNIITVLDYLGYGGTNYLTAIDSNGRKIGSEFPISEIHDQYERKANIANLSSSSYLVFWIDNNNENSHKIIGKLLPINPQKYSLNEFQLINPNDDTSLKLTNPKFCWNSVSKIPKIYPWSITYNLYISNSNDFQQSEIFKNIEDTTFQLPNTLKKEQNYYWKVQAMNWEYDSLWSSNVNGFFVSNDAVTDISEKVVTNCEYSLNQNFPNPFNPSTMINYQLAMSNDVRLEVYNILGENVAILVSEKQQAGNYSVNFDATGLSSGIYFYRLQVGNKFQETKKMMYLR